MFRCYNDDKLRLPYGGTTVTVRLHNNDEGASRKLNRSEMSGRSRRPIPISKRSMAVRLAVHQTGPGGYGVPQWAHSVGHASASLATPSSSTERSRSAAAIRASSPSSNPLPLGAQATGQPAHQVQIPMGRTPQVVLGVPAKAPLVRTPFPVPVPFDHSAKVGQGGLEFDLELGQLLAGGRHEAVQLCAAALAEGLEIRRHVMPYQYSLPPAKRSLTQCQAPLLQIGP